MPLAFYLVYFHRDVGIDIHESTETSREVELSPLIISPWPSVQNPFYYQLEFSTWQLHCHLSRTKVITVLPDPESCKGFAGSMTSILLGLVSMVALAEALHLLLEHDSWQEVWCLRKQSALLLSFPDCYQFHVKPKQGLPAAASAGFPSAFCNTHSLNSFRGKSLREIAFLFELWITYSKSDWQESLDSYRTSFLYFHNTARINLPLHHVCVCVHGVEFYM